MRDLHFSIALCPEVFLYDELKEFHTEIRNLENSTSDGERHSYSDNEQMLFLTIHTLLECSEVARTKGILELETYANEAGAVLGSKYLIDMVQLIVDGTDPEIVRELCYCRYCASNLSGCCALQYFMILTGVLSIQKGEYRLLLEKRLKHMLPEKLFDEYSRRQEAGETWNDT